MFAVNYFQKMSETTALKHKQYASMGHAESIHTG